MLVDVAFASEPVLLVLLLVFVGGEVMGLFRIVDDDDDEGV